MNPVLTIAIPTWHNLEQLDWCLRSIALHTEYPYQLVVVNNEPRDREVLARAPETSQLGNVIRVLEMGQNAGWEGGINAALAQCETKFFCMLNDDTVVTPNQGDFWRKLVGSLDDPSVGAVGPCSNFVAGAQSLMQLHVPTVVTTSLLIGMCVVVRTDELRAMGGLDAKLPGGDDLDLSIRYLEAGKQLLIRRDCYLHHFGQQTGGRVQGGKWNSREHQEATNNALIQKHGLKAWYRTFTAGWSPVTYSSWYPLERDEVGKALDPLRRIGARGLNLGCGANEGPWDGLEVVGVDQRPVGDHGQGGTKQQEAKPDLIADVQTCYGLPSEQDFLLALHVLEHLLDPLDALIRWRGLVKPGGKLILTVPDHSKLPSIVMDSTHLHAFDPGSLKRLLEAAGWTVDRCDSIAWGVVLVEGRAL